MMSLVSFVSIVTPTGEFLLICFRHEAKFFKELKFCFFSKLIYYWFRMSFFVVFWLQILPL